MSVNAHGVFPNLVLIGVLIIVALAINFGVWALIAKRNSEALLAVLAGLAMTLGIPTLIWAVT